MVDLLRPAIRTMAALVALQASSVLAAPPIQLRNEILEELRKPRAAGEMIVIRDIDLGGDGTDTLELEPMEIWASDAKILVWGPAGKPTEMAIPKYENFKGRVVGDDESLVFLSYRKGRLAGSIIAGRKKFNLGTAIPVRDHRPRYRDPNADLSGERLPIILVEVDDMESVGDPAQSWTCDLDKTVVTSERPAALGPRPVKSSAEAGGVAGATYTLKLGLDTDNELCAGFGNNATSVTNYFNDLIGKSNIIYERDVATSLVISVLSIRNGGAGTDPYTKVPADGSFAALDEFGDVWSANFAATQRSAALLISGKAFFGGVAWLDNLCTSDFYCGDTGSNCCNPNVPPADYASCLAAFAGVHIGPYGFVGSLSSVQTTNADPTTTIDGHEFAMPNTASFWILAAFTHELGHTVASPHSWCVPPGGLSPAEKTLYGIGTTSLPDRNFVDTSSDGGFYNGNACFVGDNTFPTEWGTIMSYSHNHFDDGARASRFIFGKTGEASELMLPIMKGGVDGATPDGTITIGTAPLTCSAGKTASVPNFGGLTYAWQSTGGTITSATNTASITFTPNAPNVTVTVTITNTATSHGCSITTSATRATACEGLAAPTGVVATATTSTNVALTWTAVGPATNYKVLRSTNGTDYSQVGNPGENSFNDATAVANTAYLYKVRANDGGSDSGDSNIDLATTVIFTDPTLTVGTTTVKTTHISQLRTAVNAVRTLASLGAAVFTDPTLTASSTAINRLHVTELRAALDAARLALALSAVSYTDPTITVGTTTVKAAHINNLRGGVQ